MLCIFYKFCYNECEDYSNESSSGDIRKFLDRFVESNQLESGEGSLIAKFGKNTFADLLGIAMGISSGKMNTTEDLIKTGTALGAMGAFDDDSDLDCDLDFDLNLDDDLDIDSDMMDMKHDMVTKMQSKGNESFRDFSGFDSDDESDLY